MKRHIIPIVLIIASVLCIMLFGGCAGSDDTAAPESAAPTEIPTEPTEEPVKAPAVVDPDAVYEYEVREIWCENNGQRIYGEAYIPMTEGRSPLVIHCHGLGSNHEVGASYGKKYAPRGIAVYTMDFRGGSNTNNENRSDGKTTEMSVMTEVSDVEAILEAARSWDFVDPERIFLQGGSQGGLVAAIAGVRFEDDIAGLILHYPAFGMYDFIHYSRDYDDFPEEFDVAGMTVGRVFGQDLWDYDVREYLPDFDKPVLILQGSEDSIVLPYVTREAYELYPDAEYHIIEGAAHGFSGEHHEEASRYGLDFLFRHI